MQYFSLLFADGETEVCAGYGKFVYAALHIRRCISALRAQSSANRKSLVMSILTLVFARMATSNSSNSHNIYIYICIKRPFLEMLVFLLIYILLFQSYFDVGIARNP